jgi:hypothetical protein
MVNRDAAVTGVPGPCRLDTHDDWVTPRGRPFVRAWDGHCGHGSGVAPSAGAAPETALLAVADDAQDAIMEALWSAWPVCPDHNLGLHVESHDGTPVWCPGGRHVVAPIGRWPS